MRTASHQKLSETWRANDLFVKMEGGVNDTQYAQNSIDYLWNLMDMKACLLRASRVSTHKNVDGAVGGVQRGAECRQGQHIWEGFRRWVERLPACHDLLEKEEQTRTRRKNGISKSYANNNRIERLNWTLCRGVKVQRGWKNPASKIVEEPRIHYNFVKPHSVLEGRLRQTYQGSGFSAARTAEMRPVAFARETGQPCRAWATWRPSLRGLGS